MRLHALVPLVLLACSTATPPLCDPTQCEGCCGADGICHPSGPDHCGEAGAACSVCAADDLCLLGKCVDTTAQSGGGSGGGGPSATGGSGNGSGGGTVTGTGGGTGSGSGGGTITGTGGGTASGSGGGTVTGAGGGVSNTNCSDTQHLCLGQCVSNDSIDHCGPSCTPCPSPSHGGATCNGVFCAVFCNSGFHRCGSLCVSDTALATCGSSCNAPCTDPANGRATCNGVSCDFTCNPGFCKTTGGCSSFQFYPVVASGSDPDVAVAPAGAIHVAFKSSTGPAWVTSTNGTTFTAPVTLDTPTAFSSPVIAVSTTGQVGVAWVDYSATSRRVRYARKSTSSWVVETVATGTNASAVDLAYDSSGGAHVVYRDGDYKYVARGASSWGAVQTASTFTGGVPKLAMESPTHPVICFWRDPTPSAPNVYGLNLITKSSTTFNTFQVATGSTSRGVGCELGLDTFGQANVGLLADGELKYLPISATTPLVATSVSDQHTFEMVMHGNTPTLAAWEHDDTTLGATSYLVLATRAGAAWTVKRIAHQRATVAIDNNGNALFFSNVPNSGITLTRPCGQ